MKELARKLVLVTAIGFVTLAAQGCGKSVKATLQLAKVSAFEAHLAPMPQLGPSSVSMLGNETPTSLKIKMIAAYLAEDIDPATQNNVGNTQMFWLNSDCNDDISSCNDTTLSSFFDFTNPDAANATLNSQGKDIDTGEYRYVRLEFCKYGASGNIQFVDAGTSGTHTVSMAQCTQNSAKIDPPLKLESGKDVKIVLSYSIADTINTSTASGTASSNCEDVSGTRYCYNGITLTPSAVTE